MRTLTFLAAISCFAPIAAGCKSRALPDPMRENTLPMPQNQQAQPEKPQTQPNTAITLTASSDKTAYNRGEIIKFTLVAENKSDQIQTLTFTSGRTFDLGATRDGEPTETWRWARDKVFTQAFKTLTLKPGDRHTFSAIWDQTADNGQIAPRGNYQIIAELPLNPRIFAAPLNVELKD